MSKKALDRLKAQFGDRILATSSLVGDDEAIVAPGDWRAVATFLRDDPELRFDHWTDITAVDYPFRAESPEGQSLPRFDVVFIVRSTTTRARVRIKTRVGEGEPLASLVPVWPGANWGEREMWDMFGIALEGHPDLRRILTYDEFVGHPLRKDYPIEKTQPLVPYRDVEGTEKLPPFGPDEGQPWSRVNWTERMNDHDFQVSPAIGLQQQQRPTLSQGIEYTDQDDHAVSTAKD